MHSNVPIAALRIKFAAGIGFRINTTTNASREFEFAMVPSG